MKKEVIISKGIKSILKKNVIGIYLHGSVATEGHRSWTSDIDLFILLKDHLSKEDKEALIKYLNKFRNPMVEASFVLEKDVKSLGYPMNFELYFHPDEICENGESKEVLLYLYELKKIGKRLYGKPKKEVFSKVPKKYFVLSIVDDVKSPGNSPVKKPTYGGLNLCRTLAFLHEDRLFSKLGGGTWAVGHLPKKYHCLVRNMIIAHKGSAKIRWNKLELEKFREYMLDRIVRQSKIVLNREKSKASRGN